VLWWFPLGGWLLLILLVLGGLLLGRIVMGGGRTGWSATGRRTDPEQILDERFARGEIDEEDYLSRRGLLRQLREEEHDERYLGRWRWW
jgi:putative membrane protein